MDIKQILLQDLRKQAMPNYNILKQLKRNSLIKNYIYEYKIFMNDDNNVEYHDLTYALDLLYNEQNYVAQCKYVCNNKQYNKSLLVDCDEIIDNMIINIYSGKVTKNDLPWGIYEEKHPYQISINPETGEYNPEIYLPSNLELIFPVWDGEKWIRGDFEKLISVEARD